MGKVKTMPQSLSTKNIKKVLDTKVGRYRIIAVQFDPSIVEKYIPYGREMEKEVYEIMCGGVDLSRGECEAYVGTPLDYAVARVLSEYLGYDFTPTEEPGYGLPEFSIYRNPDVRSWCGKWGYKYKGEYSYPFSDYETGLLWMLIPSDSPYFDKVIDIVDNVLDKYDNVAIAIIRED